jgi:hypothetical protein
MRKVKAVVEAKYRRHTNSVLDLPVARQTPRPISGLPARQQLSNRGNGQHSEKLRSVTHALSPRMRVIPQSTQSFARRAGVVPKSKEIPITTVTWTSRLKVELTQANRYISEREYARASLCSLRLFCQQIEMCKNRGSGCLEMKKC